MLCISVRDIDDLHIIGAHAARDAIAVDVEVKNNGGVVAQPPRADMDVSDRAPGRALQST